jgi:hypothetical protein
MGLPFDAGAAIAFIFELPDELVCDGPYVPLRAPRCEHHMVAHRGLSPQVDGNDIFSLCGVERVKHDIEEISRTGAK